MYKSLQNIKTLSQNTKGATAIEYGLIAELISVVITASVFGAGNTLGDSYNQSTDTIVNAIDGANGASG